MRRGPGGGWKEAEEAIIESWSFIWGREEDGQNESNPSRTTPRGSKEGAKDNKEIDASLQTPKVAMFRGGYL